MVQRKHKTLVSAKKAITEAKKKEGCLSKDYKVFKVKGASIWKFKVATELEWLHGLV